MVRFFPYGKIPFKKEDKRFIEDDIYAADSTVFEVFDHEFIKGNPKTALDQPKSIVITESMAERIFGSTDVLGEVLLANDTSSYKVTGVIKDIPKNSHFTFTALLSPGFFERSQNNNWGNFGIFTYIVLPQNYDFKKLEAKFPQVYDKYVKEIFGRMKIKIDYELQPLTTIHLHSKLEFESQGDISYIYTFSAVAVFMLLIAAINYMNLATARSARRAKEVGIRKVVGSFRSTLMAQFLTESVLLTIFAVILSIGLAFALLPFFNEVSGKSISFQELVKPQFILIALAIAVFTGLLSGSYPSFYLSSFEPASVLKGSVSAKGGNPILRKSLVVFQFFISLTMLICTLIVYRQLEFMRNKDLGYDKAQVLTVDFQSDPRKDKFNALRNELLKDPRIKSVASSTAPTSNIKGRIIFTIESNEGMKEMGFLPMAIDHNYITAMGMKITQGRDFSEKYPADTALGVIVNEAAVARMAWKDPIGKKVRGGGNEPGAKDQPPMGKVVGVVKNFHQSSLYNPIEPLIMLYRPTNNVIHIKLDVKDVQETTAFIENKWKEFFPDRIFEYKFLDQDFEAAYHADGLRGRIFTAFSAMTIFIACLGLFGLATFTALQRTKEISIRKVLGASVGSITALLSKEFLKLVLLSITIACPVAYFAMKTWLQDFAYRIEINHNWWIFLTAGVIAILVAFITVSYQAIKAAISNPVKSLRSE